MNVPINEDFEKEFKVEAWKGFDLREVAALGITAGIAAGIACFLHFITGLPLTTSFYTGLVPSVPVAVMAFFRSPTGQTLPEHLDALRYRKATAELPWQSMEFERAWGTYRAEEQKILKAVEAEEKSREQEAAREAAELESMKKAYRKHIRKKHREEARERRQAGRKKDPGMENTEDNGINRTEEAAGKEAGTDGSQAGNSGSPGAPPDPAGNTESGKDSAIPGEEAAPSMESAGMTFTAIFRKAEAEEDWERISAGKAEIRRLSAELEQNTREHKARLKKKGV